MNQKLKIALLKIRIIYVDTNLEFVKLKPYVTFLICFEHFCVFRGIWEKRKLVVTHRFFRNTTVLDLISK